MKKMRLEMTSAEMLEKAVEMILPELISVGGFTLIGKLG
jgi:hypothetical protein